MYSFGSHFEIKERKKATVQHSLQSPPSHHPNQRLRSSLYTAPIFPLLRFPFLSHLPRISKPNISKLERETAKNLNNSRKHLKVKILSLSLSSRNHRRDHRSSDSIRSDLDSLRFRFTSLNSSVFGHLIIIVSVNEVMDWIWSDLIELDRVKGFDAVDGSLT
ncbi:hypothetical protein AKJ16_DCAP04882 [Drosera capensis]